MNRNGRAFFINRAVMPARLKLFPEVMNDANFRLTLRVMSSFHLHYHTYKLQNKSLIFEK